jgi:hypothetical protein
MKLHVRRRFSDIAIANSVCFVMNSAVKNLYESTIAEHECFQEEIRFNDLILNEGMIIPGYDKMEDYKSICSIIQDTMKTFGIELIIATVCRRKIAKGTAEACYVRLCCASAKHISDEKRAEKLQTKEKGGVTGKPRNTNTKRIADCPCTISLNWRSDQCIWKVGATECTHEGHRKVTIRVDDLSHEEKIEVLNMRNDSISAQAVINYIRRTTSKRVSSVQIHNICQNVVDGFGEIIQDTSKSGQLLKYFNSIDDVIYIARFNKRKRDEPGTIIGQLCQIKIPGHSSPYDRPDRFSDISIQDILEMPHEQMIEVLPQIDSKKDSSAVFELYAITWVSLDNLKTAKRYPEVLMTDATCKTNSSNRPLIFVCGIDSTHKNICVSSTLTTNEKRESFSFVIENLALIYGRNWCSKVQVFLSDGATEITGSIDSAINSGLFNPERTKRFLCHHHAVNIKGLKDLTYLKTESETKLRGLIFMLIYRGFRDLETQEESKIFFRSVYAFLQEMRDEGKLSEESHVKFSTFLEAVLDNSPYLSNVFAKEVMHLGTRTSGRNESENSSAKATGVDPKTSVVKLAVSDVTRNVNRAFESTLRVQREALVRPIESFGYESISAQITGKAWELLNSQLNLYADYNVVTISMNPVIFAARRLKYPRDVTHELQSFAYETEGSPVIHVNLPKFYRTRYVQVINGHLQCSCPYFAWYGIPCRHMLAVNKGFLSIFDINLRWTTAYAQGLLDDKLQDIDTTTSIGAICRANAGDFQFSPSLVANPNDHTENDDANDDFHQNEDVPDEVEGGNEFNDFDSEQKMESLNNLSSRKLNPRERYLAISSRIEELKQLGNTCAVDPDAAEFFIEHSDSIIKAVGEYIKHRQNISYENLSEGSVVDPLTIKPTMRSSARTKRADEIATSNKRPRKSTITPSLTAVNGAQIQFEAVIRGKGRPSNNNN